MSFLAPLFLAGAAAVALPFLFHLIRRSSRERVLFSSLMFLEPSPPRITKRSRLEHLLLLLMRCAVLCLLALAFARPFFPKPMSAASNGSQNSRVAIILDTSASMRREALWTEAKVRAAEAVRRLGPGDALALYTFDRQLHPVLHFEDTAHLLASERAALVESRLAAVSPSWLGTHLGRTILNATEELIDQLNRDSRDQGNSALRLVIVSDFQAGAHLDGLQGFEWPKKFQVELLPVAPKENSNAGLQVLEEAERAFSAVTNQPVRLRVSNSKGSKIEQFTVQWRRGADPAGDKIKVYVPAGQSRIVNSPPRENGADSVALSGDAVDFDNQAWIASRSAPPVTIAYYGSEAADDPHAPAYYLRRAFEQTNLTTRLVTFTNAVPAEARSAALLITAQPLNSQTAELARTLLREGKTVFVSLSAPEGAAALSSLLGAPVTAREADVPNYALFGRIDFQHPLFAPFSDARFSDFTKIHFWKYRALDLSRFTNANVVATLDSGAPLLAEIPVDQGRILLCASTWAPSDSQLALSSKFIPLLFGILERSAKLDSGARQFIAGDPVTLPPSVNQLTLPDGATRPISSRTFSETLSPGIYKSGSFNFAVNVDPAESRLNPLKPEDFSALGVPLTSQASPAELSRAKERQRHLLATEAEARQKLWREFLIAAIAFVFIETWLSGRLSRRVSSVPA